MSTPIVNKYSERWWNRAITVISIAVVAVVALLIFLAGERGATTSQKWIYILPKLNAFINGSVFVLLLVGFYFIKRKQIQIHNKVMLSAFILSSLFLVSYVIYHSYAPDTLFGDVNHDGIRDEAEKAAVSGQIGFYFALLLSHIALATIIVPLALFTIYRAWSARFDKHKKIARITWPIWLYVSLTGVIVYLMISPYYPV